MVVPNAARGSTGGVDEQSMLVPNAARGSTLCNNKVNVACSNTYVLKPKIWSTFAPKTGYQRSVPLQLVSAAWAATALPQ